MIQNNVYYKNKKKKYDQALLKDIHNSNNKIIMKIKKETKIQTIIFAI